MEDYNPKNPITWDELAYCARIGDFEILKDLWPHRPLVATPADKIKEYKCILFLDQLPLRASSLSGHFHCIRSSVCSQYPDLVRAHGFTDIRDKSDNIAAVIGSSVHKGLEAIVTNTGTPAEAALDTLSEKVTAGVEFDPPTKRGGVTDVDTASQIVHKMLEVLAPIAAEMKPEDVEVSLEAQHEGVLLTGHPDIREQDGTVWDWKTGSREPSPQAQLGAYKVLFEKNGKPVPRVGMIFAQRVGLKTTQPAPIKRTFDGPKLEDCEKLANATIKQIKRDVATFVESGDIYDLPVNVMSPLCSERWCVAWGTSACSFGKGGSDD